MSYQGVSFPYPVLGNSEDVNGSFRFKLDLKKGNDKIVFSNISYEIDNEYFLALVKSKRASVFCSIRCSATLYFHSFDVTELNSFEIQEVFLAGKIEVKSTLVAIEQITDYTSSSFNEDAFLGENQGVFIVPKGGVIGFGGGFLFDLGVQFKRGLTGIIEFHRRSFDMPMEIDLGEQKIIIYYPHDEDQMDIVNCLSNRNSGLSLTFLNLFVLPALTEGYRSLIDRYSYGELEEYIAHCDWAFVLNSMVSVDSSSNDPFNMAQKLLQKLLGAKDSKLNQIPILSSFQELNKIDSSDESI
jgi:hypothetical protein